MNVQKHIKEHNALGVTPDPFLFVSASIMETSTNWKALVPGAVPPFDIADPGGTIGDAGTSISKMKPRFFPFIFPYNGAYDLVNVGLVGNSGTTADRIRVGFFSMEGIFLFERVVDFTAGVANSWLAATHEVAEQLMPRAILMCVFPELQADDTGSATVSLGASSSAHTTSIALPELFSASGSPITTDYHTPGGLVLNEEVTRPLIFQDLGTNWTSTPTSAINKLEWGNATFSGAAHPALRVSMRLG